MLRSTQIYAGNKLQPGQGTDSPTRVPFSPVSASQQRLNTNSITHSEENQSPSAVVKATNNMRKSPLSSTTLNRPMVKTGVVDEHNTALPNLTAVTEGALPNVEPSLLHTSNAEPSLSMAQNQQAAVPIIPQVVHRPQEYSFEEKRLAFMYHYQQSHVSAICR